MYNSISSHNFLQQNPRFLCRHARRFAEISELKGYPVRCRDSRCSQACRNNWQQKHGACLARLLHDLPAEFRPYRGNLTLPKDASPADHQRVKKEFLRIVNRWKTKHGYTVEIHAVLHPTDRLNAHWDFVTFSDSPATPFRQILSDAWSRAGGLRCSRVAMDGTELDATAKYQSKATRVDRQDHKLLAPQSECGVDSTWSTRGFWRGSSVDRIWSELLAEWFPKDGTAPIEDRDIRAKVPPYIPGVDVDLDRLRFAAKLPIDPSDFVGVSDYAARWGVDANYMLSVLRSIPQARCLNGWTDPRTKRCIYNGWYVASHSIGSLDQNIN